MILKSAADIFRASAEFRELAFPAEGASVEGISPSAFPFIISAVFSEKPNQYLVITENSQKAQDLFTDLTCLLSEDQVFLLPPWETLPYEPVVIPEKTEGERISVLYRILSGTPGVFVTCVEAAIRRVPEPGFFLKKGLLLEKNQEYPFDDIIETLVSYGYTREPMIETRGEFSVKGGIIDVFLPAMDDPVRLDFFGDTLDDIRLFDADTQVSSEKLKKITLYPRRELLLLPKEKKALQESLLDISSDRKLSPETENILENTEGRIPGLQDIFQLTVPASGIISWFRKTAGIILCDPVDLTAKETSIINIFNELFSRKQKDFFCLPPEKLLDTEIFDRAKTGSLKLQTFMTSTDVHMWKMKSIPGFQGKIKQLREETEKRIQDGWRVILSTGFEGQARRLKDLMASFEPSDEPLLTPLSIIISPYREGLEISSSKILLLTDSEIFGRSYKRKTRFHKKNSRPIDSFLDLNPGDCVVHINHGIGVFRKIERMTAGGVERDFLVIDYAGDDRLYVSLDQITLVQKYIGMEGKKPRLDALGKKSAWNKIRDRVQASVEEIAGELIEIYSKRSALKGFQYPPDTMWQEEFESLFEFEETPDQITAIEDVKDDMEKDRPMDRLVCGDVGFGKTEVAIRAAFKAVMAGRQVAVLVPTTILAMQHFNTFKRRFAGYPITIDMMSRFRSRAQITETKAKLAAGSVDIIIGTHSLLSKGISIKNLGLLVIDEEQKFGVKHKEQLKRLRETVDVLTLSATPIPRTLHMSLSGMRDLSTIATPPENRQAIETYVMEENPDILRAAIINELNRDGQVFYVHNRVQNIEAQAQFISELVPEASVCTAHGQMDENSLEDIMMDFMDHKFDVLVSTTIMESGLDIPNANTIIINRADTFGLSQLYQMKGRVGRSSKKSYAYLFYPRHIALTEDAAKRLKVISEYSELGSGFKIAMKDLEIRGAGNILGREQSGSIMEVGFELYCQMLEDAVKKLKGEKPSALFRTGVFIKSDFYIPETYISDERQKIEFYKRFEACENLTEVDLLKREMTDRFGTPPEQVNMLIAQEEVRAMASSLFINEISEQDGGFKIRISDQCLIESSALVRMLAMDKRLSVEPGDTELLIFKTGNVKTEKKLSELKKWLQQFLSSEPVKMSL